MLAHHFTQAGLTEAAIEWWGKAGQRSLERSALVEAIKQLTRALDQIATVPATPALRREQIKLQVALITLVHVSTAWDEIKAIGEGTSSGSSKSSHERSLRQLSTLASRRIAAEKVVNGHPLGTRNGQPRPRFGRRSRRTTSLALCSHRDRAIAAVRVASFGVSPVRVVHVVMLGYPEAALADADQALSECARDRPSGHTDVRADTHHWPLSSAEIYAIATAIADELVALADDKDTCTGRRDGR